MSRPLQDVITCQTCSHEQAFTTWDSLNVSLDPERKQKLLRGELTRFVCAKCGWSSEVVYPLLYHDGTKADGMAYTARRRDIGKTSIGPVHERLSLQSGPGPQSPG